MTKRQIIIEKQSWPLANEFRISRGVRTSTEVIQLTIHEGNKTGWAECVPYSHYDESLESVVAQIESVQDDLESGIDNAQLNKLLPAGAARNAIDCALWDLEAKKQAIPLYELLNLKPFNGTISAQTISLDSPEAMAASAESLKDYPLLKIKLDQLLVLERMTAVSNAAPNSQFIIDANEAWDLNELKEYAEHLVKLNVVLIEQPLPANNDTSLISYQCPIPLCADESVHTSNDLDKIADRYQAINIKLDKTGGLTEAIKLRNLAQEKSLNIMVGCMVGTSLAMAPASLLANDADFVDLDAPALLAKDKPHGFTYHNGQMSALSQQLWGGAS